MVECFGHSGELVAHEITHVVHIDTHCVGPTPGLWTRCPGRRHFAPGCRPPARTHDLAKLARGFAVNRHHRVVERRVSDVTTTTAIIFGSMRPEVAATLVRMGYGMEGVETALDVDRGIARLASPRGDR